MRARAGGCVGTRRRDVGDHMRSAHENTLSDSRALRLVTHQSQKRGHFAECNRFYFTCPEREGQCVTIVGTVKKTTSAMIRQIRKPTTSHSQS